MSNSVESKTILKLRIMIIANSCVDENVFVPALNIKNSAIHLYSIELICGYSPLPEGLGDNPEHRAAIEFKKTRVNRVIRSVTHDRNQFLKANVNCQENIEIIEDVE